MSCWGHPLGLNSTNDVLWGLEPMGISNSDVAIIAFAIVIVFPQFLIL